MWLATAFPPRRPSGLLKFIIPVSIFLSCLYYIRDSAIDLATATTDGFSAPSRQGTTWPPHPIDTLIDSADRQFADLLAKEAHTLEEAAAAYRTRRGRHPPPGFEQWYRFARERHAVMVEDFWDNIYHDLEPFWALKPSKLRTLASDFEMTIRIRDGKTSTTSDWFWTRLWQDMINTIAHMLPDMDVALNPMDEPRLVVPWETMEKYMTAATKTRKMADPASLVAEYRKLDSSDKGNGGVKEWESMRPYWPLARRGCRPDSAARKAGEVTDFDRTPDMRSEYADAHMYHGFVANFTLMTDLCHQPDLQALHGALVRPLTVSTTRHLFPLFGGSKLSVNNEILLPPPMYWSEEEKFSAGGEEGGPWRDKRDRAVWRGVASGGWHDETNWKTFQRHRFVAMNNATTLAAAEQSGERPVNFPLPLPERYGLAAQEAGELGRWVGRWSDVAFIDLSCHESHEKEEAKDTDECGYVDAYFSRRDGVRMADQFRDKYLPDIDGNSFSGRYRGFLQSSSLPVKATMFREWHDSRLLAWKHFVPMDNRFLEWYAIMEYFLGYGHALKGRDTRAEKIAIAGREWADRVLRKDDMVIYVFRLLLEYARVSDERRESMGWADDLRA